MIFSSTKTEDPLAFVSLWLKIQFVKKNTSWWESIQFKVSLLHNVHTYAAERFVFPCEMFSLSPTSYQWSFTIVDITECRLQSESVCAHMWAALALLSSSNRVGPPPSVISNVPLMTQRRLFRKPKLTCRRKHSVLSVTAQPCNTLTSQWRFLLENSNSSNVNKGDRVKICCPLMLPNKRCYHNAMKAAVVCNYLHNTPKNSRPHATYLHHVSPGKAHWGSQRASRSRHQSGSSSSAGLWV